MYYLTVFLAVLASSHILVHSHYVKKRAHSDLDHNSEECDDPFHVHEVIIGEEPLGNSMTSREKIVLPTKVKTARVKRFRKSKRPSDPNRDDENDRNDTSNVNKNINKNVNSNVNRNVNTNVNKNVNRHKNRPKDLQRKTKIPKNHLEIMEFSDSDELVDGLNGDRETDVETDNTEIIEFRKRNDRNPNRSSASRNMSRASKKNVSLDIQNSERVKTSSTPKPNVEVSSAAPEVDVENSSDDIDTSSSMENEDELQDSTENQKQQRLLLKKQLDLAEKRQSKLKPRVKIMKKHVDLEMSHTKKQQLGKQRVEEIKKVKDELLQDFGNVSESSFNPEGSEEYQTNMTTSPLDEDDDDLDLEDNLDERNQTAPSLRRMFPKFKAMKDVRGPQWSDSDLLKYAKNEARKRKSDGVPANRILQDEIDPAYLPERFKPVKRTKILKKYKRIRKIRHGKKNKSGNVIERVKIVPLTQRPIIKKYKVHYAKTIEPVRTSGNNDDIDDNDRNDNNDNHDHDIDVDVNDDADDDDKPPTDIQTDQRSPNTNVNRNVNVNNNINNNRDTSGKREKKLNDIKFHSNRRAIDENLKPEDIDVNNSRNKNVGMGRNENRRRTKPRELTKKELDNLLKNYEDKENQSYDRQSTEYD